MFHEKRLPSDAIQVVIEGAKRRDFVGVETVDAAIEILGCANAFRGETIGPFGAAAPAEEIQSEDDVVAAASAYEEAHEGGFGAAGDGEEAEAIPPVVLSIVWFVIQRWLERRRNK